MVPSGPTSSVYGRLRLPGMWPDRRPGRGSGAVPANRPADRASTTCSARLETLARIASTSRTRAVSRLATKSPRRGCGVPNSTCRPSARHRAKPPSSSVTRGWPNTRSIHQARGALRLVPDPSYTTTVWSTEMPSACMPTVNWSADGRVCGSPLRGSECASRSNRTAPGMCAAANSAAASRPAPGRYQETSTGRTAGSRSRSASQAVETSAGTDSPPVMRGGLAVGLLEALHELHQRATALDRHGVVDARAHAAGGAMALEPVESGLRRLGDEPRLRLVARAAEADVHDRAALPLDGAPEVPALVEEVVEDARLLRVPLRHPREPARVADPLEHLAHHVDPEGGRGIVERFRLRVRPVLQHRCEVGGRPLDEILPDDHQHDAGGAEVLLGARVDEPVAAHVDRTAVHVARRVGDERHPGGRRRLGAPLGSVDGVVGGEVHVGRRGGIADRRGGRNGEVLPRLARHRLVHRADMLRLGGRPLGPAPGHQVVRRAPLREEVHRHHRELRRRAPLEEEHVILVGNAGEIAALPLRVGDHGVEDLAAMTVLHDPDAAAGDVPDVALRRLQHRLGEDAGSGAEIPDAVAHARLPSMAVRSTLMKWAFPARIASSAAASGGWSRCTRASVALAP